ARDVVKDGVNGRLLMEEKVEDFSAALEWLASQSAEKRRAMEEECLSTAQEYSMDKCVTHALDMYQKLIAKGGFKHRRAEDSAWARTIGLLQADWELAKNLTKATAEALLPP